MKKLDCILLIDDDEATNFIHKLVITRSGYANKVVISDSGLKALDYMKSATLAGEYPKPNLIFLDINMPVMDGWEFIKAYNVLDDEQKGNVIIVMLTTSMNPNDEKRANEIDEVEFYLQKPLTNEKFELILEKYFSD